MMIMVSDPFKKNHLKKKYNRRNFNSCEYEKAWSIYKKYFPEGNEGEFDKSFVTFDATMEDVDKMNNTNYLLLLKELFLI